MDPRMTLAPTSLELMSRARGDLAIGLPIVIAHEGKNFVVTAIETLGAERFQSLRDGQIVLTARRAETLKIPAYDGGYVRLKVPQDYSIKTLAALADPARDLETPLKGPFAALRDAPFGIEAVALELIKSAQLLPAALVKLALSSEAIADLTHLDLGDLEKHLSARSVLSNIAHARVPSRFSPQGRLHVFRPDHGGAEHYAMEIGRPSREAPVLVRLHSACFTGDVLGSLKCDCGPQLHGALDQMASEGGGVLLYLNQEGRGIGLANKMRAYFLQDQGFDTVEANHRLGFEDDERNFSVGAAILADMGIGQVRLLTNNPRKIAMLENLGIKVVERVPLKVGENAVNQSYLATKAAKSGHLL